jgi:hypothetical protein
LRHIERLLPALLLLFAGRGGASSAQTVAVASTSDRPSQAGPQVAFSYENEKLQPAKYNMVIFENGAGHFHSEPGATPLEETAAYQPLPQSLDREIQLSPVSTEKIFATAKAQKFFSVACQDEKDKIAFQGTKQLSYKGADGTGSCTYNWSKIAAIQKLTELLESIAFTLEEGRRLELEHKHDRLALDAELEVLLTTAKDGRAAEIKNIQPTLQAIADDEEVLERARSRARKLLNEVGGVRAALP